MQRPTSSVPNGNCQLPPSCNTGGCRKFSRNCSTGLWGAITFAKRAQSTIRTIMISPAMAPRLARIESQTSPSGEIGALAMVLDCSATSSAIRVLPRVPDSRIQYSVKQVDQQVHRHDKRGDQQHAALKRRIVAPEDRLHQPLAD